MTTAEDVAVQMGDGFPAIRPVVDHQPVAVRFQTQFRRHFSSFQEQMPEQAMVLRGGFGDARDGLSRDKQDVCRGLGFDVAKSDDQVVFVNDVGRNLASDDFFEDGFAHKRVMLDALFVKRNVWKRKWPDKGKCLWL